MFALPFSASFVAATFEQSDSTQLFKPVADACPQDSAAESFARYCRRL
jgi:hypothetical protein